MGHIGIKDLRNAVTGVDFDDSNLFSCTICMRANIKQTSFPQHASHRATCLLEHIHCDICGPLPTCYGDYCYFILFICCHLCYISLYLIKMCEEALQSFTQFCTLVKKFCHEKITILRVDNVPELVKGKFKLFCKTTGITYEKTVPDSPNQNGVAECCNLTLASMVCALLINTDLSDWFWPFAIQTVVHIKNCIPHSILPPNKTPFEFWHRFKPNLSHLRPFGTQCTAHILSNTLSKFDSRGESGRFLGYAKDAKGYLIWVPGPNNCEGIIKTCRDVAFHDFPPTMAVAPVNDNLSPLWDDVTVPGLQTPLNEMYVLSTPSNITKVLTGNNSSEPGDATTTNCEEPDNRPPTKIMYPANIELYIDKTPPHNSSV
jgi:hypothetical protein